MNYRLFVLVFVAILFQSLEPSICYEPNFNYKYPETKYFEQKLDHFNPTINSVYHQRYLISDEYWNKNGGPIFFYTGNEGDIELFCNNTGFMWDIAPQFHAMVVFAEHRFYGGSKPFPNTKLNPETVSKFGQFTAEQALADFSELITYLKKTIAGASNSPVIAFGGSYGGMLAAWLRRKYPHIVWGALAASAPVHYFLDHVDCSAYNEVVTKDFMKTSNGPACTSNIKNSWEAIEQVAKTPNGLSELTNLFKLCHKLEDSTDLEGWLSDSWTSLAMVNYPYPTSFMNPLPEWPVEATCRKLAKPKLGGIDLLEAIRDAAGVFYNYTGQADCFNLGDLSPGLDDNFWYYQTCTEMVMPFCSNPATDMFKPANFSFEEFTKDCQKNFGTLPRRDWAVLQFGGSDWSTQSNIIFSNGELDPWQVGGIMKSLSPHILTLYIENAAHHLDLRHKNPHDPDSVKIARRMEIETIAMWLDEFTRKKNS